MTGFLMYIYWTSCTVHACTVYDLFSYCLSLVHGGDLGLEGPLCTYLLMYAIYMNVLESARFKVFYLLAIFFLML